MIKETEIVHDNITSCNKQEQNLHFWIIKAVYYNVLQWIDGLW